MMKMMKLKLAAMATMATFSAAAFSVCAVGDSITQGGGTKFVPHRVALEAEFAARGWNVEWKGTRTDPVSPNYCEGYSGKDANYIAGQYEAHAADVAADVLLIHAGHNYNCGDANLTPAVRTTEDIVAEATNSHARIIAAARAEKPDVIVLYAQVISSGGDREVKYSYITNGLNQAIATLGAELNTDASPVIVVDMAEGWDYAEDCVSDCVHPTAAGAAKMAAKWMAALKPLAAAGRLPGVDAHRKVQLWKDGPLWADTNIGAYEPWEGGDFFWWGDTIGYSYDGEGWVASDGSSANLQFVYGDASNETYGKSVNTLSGEGWITASGVLAPERDAAHVRWGGDWRLPTEKEIADLVDNCDWTLTATNGVSGFVVRGRGAYSANSIFLPAAGWGNDSIHNVNEVSYFWSSVPHSSYCAHMLRISTRGGEGGAYTAEHTDRYFGFSVRPVQTSAPPAPVVGGEWLDERAGTTLTTGAWSSTVAYGSDGRAAIKDNTFTPTVASAGNAVTVEAKARFFVDDREYTPAATDQAAIRLTSTGFQVWSGGAWLPVSAPGVTPEDGAEYTLRFTFDYTARTYSVESGSSRFRATGGTENFPLAASSTTAVSSIAFVGDTDFTSLVGEYVKRINRFMLIFR